MDIGKIWPGWEVAEYIGEGAFGKVYKITREDFGHTYESALKVITIPANNGELMSVLNDGFDEESATMFFRGMVEDIVEEFVLMSKLRGNTNIVSYEDHAVIPHDENIGWDIYIRMELLTPLFDHVKGHSLSIRDVITLGIDMCQALEVCQKYNIIHRDIKPENIFVSNLGRYKLGDFGIARQLEKTSSGLSKKGTYSYMAPEVYKGEEYNSTVDIYSLGIVLYRFLNQNRTPFLPLYPEQIRYSDREKANILRFSGEKMKPPCNAKGRLAEIILKACAYDPKERYESAQSMREALQGILYSEQETELAYPTGDELKNETNEYVFSSSSTDKKAEAIDIIELEDDSQEQPDDEKTRALSVQLEEPEPYAGNIAGQVKEAQKKVEEGQETGKIAAEEKKKPEKSTAQKKSAEKKSQAEKVKGEKISEEKKAEKQKVGEKISKEKKHAEKNLIYITVAVVAVLAIVGVILSSVIKKNNQTEVPDFSVMTLQEAENAAAESGLVIVQGSESYSDTVKKGEIISQNMEAGTTVEKETAIEVEVSLGTKTIEVPEVVGLTEEEAGQALEQKGLTFEYGEPVYSDSMEEGKVISQSPEAKTAAKEKTVVKLILSKGIEPVMVPDVVGMTEQEAKDALKGAGLKVKSSEEEGYNDSVEAGRITGQDIASGESVAPGTKVNITISKGPEPQPEEPVSKPAAQKPTASKSQTVKPQQQSQPQQPQEQPQQQPQEQPQQPQEQPQPQPSAPEESIDSWDLVN